MHFGRVENSANIKFSLPPDGERTKRFLNLNWAGRKKIYIGCPVWSEKTWIGSIYPSGIKSSEMLKFYSELFNTVEVNSTFYHLLDGPRIAVWASKVSTGFKFCPKVFRDISEQLDSPLLRQHVRNQAAAFSHFGETYGLGFIQLPESFSCHYFALLQKFLQLWPEALPISIELRHPSWFIEHTLKDEVTNLFYRHKAATVITDTPGRQDVLHTSLAQPRVMLRFQGNELAPTDYLRLDAWSKRLLNWAQRGLDEIFAFCHQPDSPRIPATARYLIESIKQLEKNCC